MYTFLFFLVSVVTALASPAAVGERIVGGRSINIEDAPYQISLIRDGYHHCGGAVINEFWAISAAQCFRAADLSYIVRVGGTMTFSGGILHRIETYIRHPSWGIPTNDANDIAVIKVSVPFAFSASVQPIALPTQSEEVRVGDNSVVTGYGYLSWGWGPSASVLQLAEVPIVDQEVCRNAYVGLGTITDGMLCAGYMEGGTGSCEGDTGGPLVIDDKIQGIVSFGRLCASRGFPDVYTRVPYYRDWIRQNTGF